MVKSEGIGGKKKSEKSLSKDSFSLYFNDLRINQTLCIT